MSSELFNDSAVVVTSFAGPARVDGGRLMYQISSTRGGANYIQLMPHQLREAAERAGLVEQENGDRTCPLCDNSGRVLLLDHEDLCVCPIGLDKRRIEAESHAQACGADGLCAACDGVVVNGSCSACGRVK